MRWVAAVIACTALILAGCGKLSDSDSGSPVDAFPGERIQAGDLEISIDSIETKNVVGDSFLSSTAAEGGVYLAVIWGYKNISRKPVDFGSMPEIHLVAPDGAEYDPDIGASATYATQVGDTTKILSDLNPGIRVSEATVFEVSKELFNAATWKLRVDAIGTRRFVGLERSSPKSEGSLPVESTNAVTGIANTRAVEPGEGEINASSEDSETLSSPARQPSEAEITPSDAEASQQDQASPENAMTLATDRFVVTIAQHCQEGEVTCDDVSYTGVNRKTGKEIHLTGSTWHTTCADGTTPCRFLGYRFTNGNITYSVHENGTLEVTQTVNGRSERLVYEKGEWSQ